MSAFGLACVMLSMGLAYVPSFPSGATQPKWWVWGAGLGLLWYFRRIEFAQPLGVAFGALVGWCLLGFVWTASPWDTVEGTAAIALFGLTALYASQLERLDAVYEAAAVVCWVQALVIFGQIVFGWKLLEALPHVPAALMLSKNMLAEFAVLALVATVWQERWWLALGPAICLVVPWMVMSSWEVIPALLAAGAVWLLTSTWRYRYFVVGLCLPAIVVISVYGFWLRSWSLLARTNDWAVALILGTVQPYGWGMNTFAALFPYPYAEYAHNEFFQIYFELGVPGVVIIFALLFYAFRAPGGSCEKSVLAALLATAALWWPFRTPAVAFLGACCLGYLLGLYRVGDHRKCSCGVLLRYCAQYLHTVDCTRTDRPNGSRGSNLPA